MQFGLEYELAQEIQRYRLSRAERAQHLKMIKTRSGRIPKILKWPLRLRWTGNLKAAVISSS